MSKRVLKEIPPKKIFWVGDGTELERCEPTGFEVKRPGKKGWWIEYKDKYGKIHYLRGE